MTFKVEPALTRPPNTGARRVVITGLGVVAPNGIGIDAFWHATRQGISGIRPISRFSTTDMLISVAGEVSGFVVGDYIERKLANRTDRSTHYALAAVQEALLNAALSLEDENRQCVGVVIASTLGGMEFVLPQFQALYTRGLRAMSAYTAIAGLQVANVGQTSIRYGISGYCKTPTHDAVGGLDALGLAYRAIRRGAADVIIAGGCEDLLEPSALLTFARAGDCVLGDDPRAYRPFDRRAAGLLLGEGAGICILEDYEHARQREAPIYGEIVGFGQTNDAHGLRSPSSDGRQYARSMRLAMQEGDLDPQDITYFSLDGRANPVSDTGEAEALRLVFGEHLSHLPVSVPRTMLGHSYGAAGAIDTITAVLALRHGLIPPTINCEELHSDYELQLVQQEGVPLVGPAALIGGRGVGGANVTLAIKKI
jgi:3-oxoacyl-(acyl-carrier-protein) synthase